MNITNRSRRLGWLLLASCVLVSLGQAPPGRAQETELIEFKIKDQFDRLYTDRRFRGSPLVLVWGDRYGSEFSGLWGNALRDSLATEVRSYRLQIVEVAHLKGVPFFIKGKIKGSFPSDRDDWLLTDWGGAINAAYHCAPDSCNLLIFDAKGKLAQHQTVGAITEPELAATLTSLRRLLK